MSTAKISSEDLPVHRHNNKAAPIMFIDFVNPRQGTDSTREFSTGNTLPLTAAPFGMTHWCVETVGNDPLRFFSPHSHSFAGIRATHQPSPWIGDYGAFRLVPQCGRLFAERDRRSSCFVPAGLRLAPHRFELELDRYGIHLEFAPTSRGAVLRCRFRRPGVRRLLLDLLDGRGELSGDGREIRGFAANHSGGVPENFRCSFSIRCSEAITATGNAPDGAWFEFGETAPELVFRIGVSFLSVEQARLNREREIGDRTPDAVAAATGEQWEEKLRRIQFDAPERDKQTFYSCFYRTLLFPREFHEFDADGNMVHYSPYDGQSHSGPLYADNGFWDTHRTVYPFFSLLMPEKYGEILAGWLNAAREGGWFPRWSSPGYRSCMTGTHIDAVFADAAVKDIPGFDLADAYRYLLKNAYTPAESNGLYGRRCLREYLRYGFVPDDRCEHAAARTMDYAANDFALAQIAAKLGDHPRHADLMRRSRNYRNLHNPATGLLQGRNADGSFPPLNPISWSGTYIEGSSYQCGLAVPHDPDGLAELLGGYPALEQRLDAMLAAPPEFEVGAYPGEIHEMAEMAAAGFGQYAHSNQPVHHLLWFYTLAGARPKAVAAIRRVTDELYTPDTLPGDEDNGEMSAWYLFAVLGFYPLSPGVPEYVTASARFDRITFRLGNGRLLEIERGGTARKTVSHRQLTAGGLLRL